MWWLLVSDLPVLILTHEHSSLLFSPSVLRERRSELGWYLTDSLGPWHTNIRYCERDQNLKQKIWSGSLRFKSQKCMSDTIFCTQQTRLSTNTLTLVCNAGIEQFKLFRMKKMPQNLWVLGAFYVYFDSSYRDKFRNLFVTSAHWL